MNILRVVVGIIVLILLIAALMPKNFQLSASTKIKASQNEVREYVKMLDNQRFYSVWVMADPKVKLTTGGVDGSVGAKQERDSEDKNVGAGEQEITKIDEGKSFEVEVRFVRPMVATNYAKTSLEDLKDGTIRVTNTFRGKNPWPMNIISMLFLPKVNKDMQQNMDNLKVQLENKQGK